MSIKPLVNLYFLLAIIVTILFITHADKGKHKPNRYTVYFLNGCESGIEMPIHGHCHHVGNFTFIRLWEQYHWSFPVSYSKNITYYCDLKRGYSGSQRQSIIAFNLARDSEDSRCGGTGECYWKITEVAIYFGNNNHTWTRAYNWSSPIAYDNDSNNLIKPQQLPETSLPYN